MKIWRSAGWPSRDPIDIDLLAGGWVSLVGDHPAQECLRLTDAGIALLAHSRQAHRRADSAHDRLALRMADHLMASGRLVWQELSLRAQVEREPPAAPAAEALTHPPATGPTGAPVTGPWHTVATEPLWCDDAAEPDVLATRTSPLQWRLARPDLFSVRRTSNPAYLHPLVHEIKVSRADLFSDLRHQAKRASYQWLCSECHYVFPAGLAEPHELPEELGVWVIHGDIETGQLELLRPARHAPCSLPFDVWMALAKASPVQRPLERTQAELADEADDAADHTAD
ncbi:MAG: hypothetical protein RI907_2195 [Pseudomonadota bacterium]|jgi:hypothetical protein